MSFAVPKQKTPQNMLIFLDTETTGLDAKIHRPIEIAFKIIEKVSGKILDSYQSVIKISEEDWKNASPGALRVNNFTWEKLTKQGKPLEQVAQEITAIFQKNKVNRNSAFFICHNAKFDHAYFIQIFSEKTISQNGWPFHWLDFPSMVFAFEQNQIVCGNKPDYFMKLGKDAIARKFGLPPEEMPHLAMNGVEHLIKIYAHVVGFMQPQINGCMY